MKKNVAVTVISALVVLALVFGILYFTNNAGKQKEIDSLTADATEKAGQIETLNADVAEKAGEIEKLNADVTEKAGEIEKLNADVTEKAGEIEKLNADVAEKASQIETLNADVTEKAGEIEKLNADVAEKASQIETLNADVTEKAGEIEKLNADVAEKASQIEALNADVAEKAGQIETLNADVAAKAGEIEKLNADVTEKAGQIETLNTDVAAKAGEIEKLTAGDADKDKEIEALRAENESKDSQIRELTTEVQSKDELITTLQKQNVPEDTGNEAEENPGEVKAIAEEKTEETPAAPESNAFTLNGKVTMNQRYLSMIAGMYLQGDKGKLAKLNSLIDFVNGLEFQVLCDGVDAEGFVSLKGENLASGLMLGGTDKVTVMTDVLPSYSFLLTKDDVALITPQTTVSADSQKLLEAVLTPLMKMLQQIRFGETELVEETILDTAFTTRTPLNMTTKEILLLALNTSKEILENPDAAAILDGMKNKGLNLPIEKLDELITQVSNMKDEDLPAMDAALYTNANGDMIGRAVLTKDGQEMMSMLGGMVNGTGVSEYKMGDQMYTSVKVGNDGISMVIKALGMNLTIEAVPETRANGKAVVVRVTMSGMELLKAEIEKINEATLTGSFDTQNKTEITVRDLMEKKDEMIKLFKEDMVTNYEPVLIEKLQKVAPEVLSLLDGAKKLIQQTAPMLTTMLPAMGR